LLRIRDIQYQIANPESLNLCAGLSVSRQTGRSLSPSLNYPFPGIQNSCSADVIISEIIKSEMTSSMMTLKFSNKIKHHQGREKYAGHRDGKRDCYGYQLFHFCQTVNTF
jgi:hypothetical protein